MKGCYWGRFNPPHKGHLGLIKKILKEVDELYIVIGTAQEKNTKRNPFSGEERKSMIKNFLKEEKIPLKKIKIISLKDGPTWAETRKRFLKNFPNLDIIYTDKKRVIKHIKNIKIKKIRRVGGISSTKIRNNIANNRKWEHLTGDSVAKIIKKINRIKRIKTYEMNKKIK
jgi:nicotinamide-nucleotide adenylyltransferase